VVRAAFGLAHPSIVFKTSRSSAQFTILSTLQFPGSKLGVGAVTVLTVALMHTIDDRAAVVIKGAMVIRLALILFLSFINFGSPAAVLCGPVEGLVCIPWVTAFWLITFARALIIVIAAAVTHANVLVVLDTLLAYGLAPALCPSEF
jgi:hypothetical protein